MATILQSLGKTLAAGFVVLVLIILATGAGARVSGDHAWWAFIFRWLHVLSGLMWVGLLYYFNFVQIPSMPKIPDEHKPAISQVIAPAALFWFRWAALATVVTGLIVAGMFQYLGKALMLREGHLFIGIGMWLALVMAYNVWFIIWPNQKKALGIVQADAGARAKAARVAMLTSRFNTLLSIPMLFCMVAQQHSGL